MHRVTKRGTGATFEVTPGGVLVVQWHGVVTMAGAESVKRAIYWALQDPVAGIVSDYTGAALALDDAEMLRIMLGGPHDLAELPAAVVALGNASHALFRAGESAALHGRRWRMVCQEPAPALLWIRHRAASRLDREYSPCGTR
jgi:hypothetical protein